MANVYPGMQGELAVSERAASQGMDFSLPSVPWGYYAIAIVLGFDAFFSVGIPRLILLPLSAVLFLSLALKSAGTPMPAMMALIVYIPYAKAIAGNMALFMNVGALDAGCP